MSARPSILHPAAGKVDPRLFSRVFREGLAQVADLAIAEHCAAMPEEERAALLRGHDILMTGWGAAAIPASIAADPGRVRYICHLTGQLRDVVPLALIEAGIPVTNWGDYPADRVAEGAMALTLAVLKDIHPQVMHVRRDGWKMDMDFRGGCLKGARVGIFGLGVIGRRYLELLRPFGCHVMVFDPYVAELPGDCARAASLDELCDFAQVLVIHAALTPETRGAVQASHLARLPRWGAVINTARGAIIEQEALFRELESGRLRAGLDVLEPDELPQGHPARSWENLILTTHRVEYGWPSFGEEPTELEGKQVIALDNVRRLIAGEPLRFAFDRARYERST